MLLLIGMIGLFVLILAICFYVYKMNEKLVELSKKMNQTKDDHVIELVKQDHGLNFNSSFPKEILKLINSEDLSVYNNDSVIIFSSPYCGSCKELYPILNKMQQVYRNIQFITLMQGEEDEVIQVAKDYNLNVHVSVLNRDEMNLYKTFIFPFAYYISNGKVVSKGVINNEFDFELLLKMKETKHAS
ncbi:TlpA family protein disulfide reductase [Paenibacillus sp. Leaf72]|uniref:TlpA family protein disulfide reductase n=1 Tax=Paenibacillus sp. Leaf72 TaxID=1736234 RepID=UPI0006F491F1|nr:thioredoxin domain-containing protein [Paenibacillus sp. Leaf72]KQO17409.1 hypothetical protein ASF12_01590 [Paenibacillus sp. Leaf72]